METHAKQCLVETLQIAGAPEYAEQAEHVKEANIPAIWREGRSWQRGEKLIELAEPDRYV